jgi:riboflavin kinase/FMN adenylyltransferase
VHLLDFQGDLYGMNVEVEFLRFLRGEKKFASVQDLKAQIVRDVASVQPQ